MVSAALLWILLIKQEMYSITNRELVLAAVADSNLCSLLGYENFTISRPGSASQETVESQLIPQNLGQ